MSAATNDDGPQQPPPAAKRQRLPSSADDDDDDDLGQPSSSSAMAVSTPYYPPEQQQQQQEDESTATSSPTNTTTIRTSSLSHPTLHLTGHKSSVYTLSYSPNGRTLISGSFDTTCLLWDASSCQNYNVLKGHKNAILEVKWNNDSDRVVTASADCVLGWWDVNRGERVKRFMGHDGIVNGVDVVREGSAPLIVSASDDCTVKLWDGRIRGEVGTLVHNFQVTSVAYSLDGNIVYSGGIENCIYAWDVRRQEKTMKMSGHTDTITSLSLHPKGTHLLTNSMDNTLRTWDIRPFVTDDANNNNRRHSKTFVGGTHNAEKGLLNCAWNADGTMVTGGSGDGVVHIWDEISTEELYYLPGHKGCVNSVVFHPNENVIASGSSDKSIYVGELAQ